MIKNKTKNKVISDDFQLCKSIFSKARGLMFRLKPKTMIFEFNDEKINSLHMLFVFFPIDVLFLDKNKKIVEIKENLKPFFIYNPKNKSQYVIELKVGTNNSDIGDLISF